MLAPHKSSGHKNLTHVGAVPTRLLPDVLSPVFGRQGGGQGFVVVKNPVILEDEVGHAAIVAKVTVDAHKLTVQPAVQHMHHAGAAVSRETSRQAAHGAENALGGFH